MHNLPAHTQAIQGIGNTLDPLILPAGLDPDLLQTLRLAFEDSLNRMPAKHKFSGHLFCFLLLA
jgi:hypothetical protein